MNTLKTLLAALLITGVLFALAVVALTRLNRDKQFRITFGRSGAVTVCHPETENNYVCEPIPYGIRVPCKQLYGPIDDGYDCIPHKDGGIEVLPNKDHRSDAIVFPKEIK